MLFLVSSHCTHNIRLHLVRLLETAGTPVMAGAHAGPQRGIQQRLQGLVYEEHIPGLPNRVFTPRPRATKSSPYLIDTRKRIKIAQI